MKFLFRSFGLALLAAAVATLAYDGARMLANGGLAASSLKQLGLTFAPDAYTALEVWFSKISPYVWTAVITPLLVFPAWMTLGGLGSMFYLIGHRPKPPEIIADL